MNEDIIFFMSSSFSSFSLKVLPQIFLLHSVGDPLPHPLFIYLILSFSLLVGSVFFVLLFSILVLHSTFSKRDITVVNIFHKLLSSLRQRWFMIFFMAPLKFFNYVNLHYKCLHAYNSKSYRIEWAKRSEWRKKETHEHKATGAVWEIEVDSSCWRVNQKRNQGLLRFQWY